MKTHEIVIDAKLEFEIENEHEVLAVTRSLIWLCDALTKDENSPLKKAGFNLGEKEVEQL